MNQPLWFWYTLLVILAWGVVGIFQKLTTKYISAESTLIWQTVGFMLMIPLFLPDLIFPAGKSLLDYSWVAITWGLLVGLINNMGAWFLFAALKNEGKASIVCPIAAMAPPFGMVILAPVLLHETLNLVQGIGVLCALIAIILLSK
jgi:uncharacterized membrane protein